MVELPKNSVIFKERDQSNNQMYIILSGRVGIKVKNYLEDSQKDSKKKKTQKKNKERIGTASQEIQYKEDPNQTKLSQFNQKKDDHKLRKNNSEGEEEDEGEEEGSENEEKNEPFPELGKMIAEIGSGKAFGEQALFKDGGFRNASAFTLENSQFLMISRHKFRGVLSVLEKIKCDKIDHISTVIPFFNDISSQTIKDRLVYEFQEVAFPKGTLVTKEGTKGKIVYILLNGKVSLEKNFELEEQRENYGVSSRKFMSSHRISEFNSAEIIGDEIITQKSKIFLSQKNLRAQEYQFTVIVESNKAVFLSISKRKMLSRFPQYILQELRSNLMKKLNYRANLLAKYVEKIQPNFFDHHQKHIKIIKSQKEKYSLSIVMPHSSGGEGFAPSGASSPQKNFSYQNIIRSSILPLIEQKRDLSFEASQSLIKELENVKSKKRNLSHEAIANEVGLSKFASNNQLPDVLRRRNSQQISQTQKSLSLARQQSQRELDQASVLSQRSQKSLLSDTVSIAPFIRNSSAHILKSNYIEDLNQIDLQSHRPVRLNQTSCISSCSILTRQQQIEPNLINFSTAITQFDYNHPKELEKKEMLQKLNQINKYGNKQNEKGISDDIPQEKKKLLEEFKQARKAQQILDFSVTQKQIIYQHMKSMQDKQRNESQEDSQIRRQEKQQLQILRVQSLDAGPVTDLEQTQPKFNNSPLRKNNRKGIPQVKNDGQYRLRPIKELMDKEEITSIGQIYDKQIQKPRKSPRTSITTMINPNINSTVVAEEILVQKQRPQRYYLLEDTWDMGTENIKLKEIDLRNGLYRKGIITKPPKENSHKHHFDKLDVCSLKLKYIERKNQNQRDEYSQISRLINVVNLDTTNNGETNIIDKSIEGPQSTNVTQQNLQNKRMYIKTNTNNTKSSEHKDLKVEQNIYQHTFSQNNIASSNHFSSFMTLIPSGNSTCSVSKQLTSGFPITHNNNQKILYPESNSPIEPKTSSLQNNSDSQRNLVKRYESLKRSGYQVSNLIPLQNFKVSSMRGNMKRLHHITTLHKMRLNSQQKEPISQNKLSAWLIQKSQSVLNQDLQKQNSEFQKLNLNCSINNQINSSGIHCTSQFFNVRASGHIPNNTKLIKNQFNFKRLSTDGQRLNESLVVSVKNKISQQSLNLTLDAKEIKNPYSLQKIQKE